MMPGSSQLEELSRFFVFRDARTRSLIIGDPLAIVHHHLTTDPHEVSALLVPPVLQEIYMYVLPVSPA